jgi:hypothetical protein
LSTGDFGTVGLVWSADGGGKGRAARNHSLIWINEDMPQHGAMRPRNPVRIIPEPAMWVLMYVFSYSVSPAATNDRAEWRLLPTVVFQEFTSEERCKAAKSKLEASLSQAGARLKSGLEDLKSIGKADPSQLIIAYNVECLPK